MNKFSSESKRIFTLDFGLLFIILGLYSISIFGLYMASPFLDGKNEAIKLMIQQTTWLLLGFILISILIKLGTDRLFTMAYVGYWILLLMLLGLIFSKYGIPIPFAHKVKGTWGWYKFPGIGSFQPAEYMKIMLVIIFANIITEHNKNKAGFSIKEDFDLIFKIGLYALPALVLNVLQPDTGLPIIMVISLATMFMVAGVRREWTLFIVSFALGTLFLIIWLYYNDPALLNKIFGGSEQSYRLDRFYGWLDYEKYAESFGYHIFRSLLSIGTAGVTGHPLQTIIVDFPEAQTDFMFSVLAQNTGFIGAVLVISLSFLLDFKLLSITLKSNQPKERYLMIGVVAMLCFQQFENIGMILGLLPITGITLPFVSYGGSSYVSYMIPLAVAFSMYSENQNELKH